MIERPLELVNLLEKRVLKEAYRDDAELQQYLLVASQCLKDARNAGNSAYSRYMMAYEGLHNLAIASLLHFSVRPSDQPGHRSTAFNKFCDFIELDLGMRRIVMEAHSRRNEKTYTSPLPPLTHKQAEAVISILALAFEKTTVLVATQPV